MKHYGNIDLNFNLLQNAVLPADSDFPANPVAGTILFKNKKMYICTEIAADLPVWVPLTQELNTHVHTQSSAATAWTITHNLNTATAFVQIYDTNGQMLFPDYIDDSVFNQVTVMFSSAQAGKAVVMLGSTSGSPRSLVAFSDTFTNSNVWVVTHGLGYFPEISVYVAGNLVQPVSIVNDSTTQTTITFSSSQTGEVRCV